MKAAILFLTFFYLSEASAAMPEIRLCYEDVVVFPWITGDDKGAAINELHLVEKKLSLKFTMIRLPWKRCQVEAKNGNFEGIIAASYNDERASWGVYPFSDENIIEPDYRMHTDRFYIYTRKDSPIKLKNGRLENLGDNASAFSSATLSEMICKNLAILFIPALLVPLMLLKNSIVESLTSLFFKIMKPFVS